MKIGAQLYTVRDYCKTPEALAETLKKVADIGYTTVQVSGTCGYDPLWLDGELKKNGLSCAITHYGYRQIVDSPYVTAQAHKTFGCKYIGIGCLPGGAEGLTRYGDFVEECLPAAKALQEAGAYLMYHNHSFEFAHTEGGIPYLAQMAEDFPAEVMGFTLDTYWIQVGGGDPAAWIRRFAGRVPCIHLKDLVIVGVEQRMAPVGAGNICFDRVLSAAEGAGTEYLLVEQDNSYGRDPFGELAASYRYLRSMGLS